MTNASALYMVSFMPNRAKLLAFAKAQGTIPRSGDLGYAIHQALTATFGAAAPKPFRLFSSDRFQLLGYSPHPAAALKDYAALQAAQFPDWGLASSALGFPEMTALPMPSTWTQGRVYRFEVRTRPVMRPNRAKERGLPRECDVFLSAIESKAAGEKGDIDRQSVYTSWFEGQVPETAAKLKTVNISAMTQTQVYRRGAPSINGPDVTFSGLLEVADPEQFAKYLARGIGRHRAFGFGMLLLAPAAL